MCGGFFNECPAGEHSGYFHALNSRPQNLDYASKGGKDFWGRLMSGVWSLTFGRLISESHVVEQRGWAYQWGSVG